MGSVVFALSGVSPDNGDPSRVRTTTAAGVLNGPLGGAAWRLGDDSDRIRGMYS